MGNYANLKKESSEFQDGNDDIVIVNAVGHVPGGRTLDVSGVDSSATVIKAGTVIIENSTTKSCKPLGVTAGAYDSLPDGYAYKGILKSSVLKSDPRAAIVTIGQVNKAACPVPITSTIETNLPRIEFI